MSVLTKEHFRDCFMAYYVLYVLCKVLVIDLNLKCIVLACGSCYLLNFPYSVDMIPDVFFKICIPLIEFLCWSVFISLQPKYCNWYIFVWFRIYLFQPPFVTFNYIYLQRFSTKALNIKFLCLLGFTFVSLYGDFFIADPLLFSIKFRLEVAKYPTLWCPSLPVGCPWYEDTICWLVLSLSHAPAGARSLRGGYVVWGYYWVAVALSDTCPSSCSKLARRTSGQCTVWYWELSHWLV